MRRRLYYPPDGGLAAGTYEMDRRENSRRHATRQDATDESSELPAVPPLPGSLEATALKANDRRYAEDEVGRIIALASQIQSRKGNAPASSGAVTEHELQQLAAQFGIDADSLGQAIELAQRSHRGITLTGDLHDARKRILAHFSSVKLSPPENRMITVRPRLLVEGDDGIEIQWGTRRLTISIREQNPGKTRVEWSVDVGDAARRHSRLVGVLLGTVCGFTVAGLLAATGSLALVGLGVAGVGGVSALAMRQMRQQIEQDFGVFCDTELRNLQVLDRDLADAPPEVGRRALPGAG